MIQLTKLNNQVFTLNADAIEIVETTPNTVITMTTGKKFVVKESNGEVIEKVMKYKRQIMIPVDR